MPDIDGSAELAFPPLLEVTDLSIVIDTYDGPLTAVDGVSFVLAPGEVLGVVGESGAGKSLTGLALSGLIEPPLRLVGGRISFDGRLINTLSPSDLRRLRGRRIGHVFQDPLTALNPVFSIGHQLIETIRVHTNLSERAARTRAVDLLRDVGIPSARERLASFPHQFSGGMRQRVVIALALAGDPDLLVADEPTTALDVSIQAQILTLMKRLCTEHGKAMLLVTHDMGVIGWMADRVAVMYAGHIVEIGPVRDVLGAPRHPYTAGLVASVPQIGVAADRLPQIEGSAPRLAAIPHGCAFHPRCPRVMATCADQRPRPSRVRGVSVACHLFRDVVA